MLKTNEEIINRLGLHARAAALLVKLAKKYKSKIVISREDTGQKANADEILEVLMLAGIKGTKIVISIDGDDEKEAMEAVVELIRNKFNEAE